MKHLCSIVLMIFVTAICRAQINFVFLPEVNARTVDGLGVFQVQNMTGKAASGNILIIVSEQANQKAGILVVKTPVVTLPAGISAFPRNSFTNSNFAFSKNPYAAILSQTRNFPPGEYNYCFRFVPVDKQADEYESCFDGNIQPMVPMALLNPSDRDTICQKRPMLSWQPPMPFSAGMKFRLLLTEKKNGSTVQSLMVGTPLVLLDNITSTTINFPPMAADLKEGHTYCWQVIAHQQGVILSRSEIWEFTVQCTEKPPVNQNDSYRELKSLVNGNYYIAKGYISFSYNNRYNQKFLKYSVLNLSDYMKPVKGVPEVSLAEGFNKIDINVTELGLVEGQSYILRVQPLNEPALDVRFTYHEPIAE